MQDISLFPESIETLAAFFNGKVRFAQTKNGYRFSIDSFLLANFVRLKGEQKVIDLGTGVGILPLLLCIQGTWSGQIIGIEIQEKLTALAYKNVFMNGLGNRIKIYQGDIRDVTKIFPPSSFDVVVTNPPYYRVSSGRQNPNHQKAIARHEVLCTLSDVIESTRYLLKKNGRFFIIFPASRAITLLAGLRNASLEPKTIQWVHSRTGEVAKFILAEAYNGGGEGLHVLHPLFVYSHDGGYSQEIRTLFVDSIKKNWKGAQSW